MSTKHLFVYLSLMAAVVVFQNCKGGNSDVPMASLSTNNSTANPSPSPDGSPLPSPSPVAVGPYCFGASDIDKISVFANYLYLDILNRPADTAGYNGAVTYLTYHYLHDCSENTTTASDMCTWMINASQMLSFMQSTEFINANGTLADPNSFVTSVFQHLYRATPDAATVAAGITLYNSLNGDRKNFLYNIAMTDKYRKRFTCNAP